MSVAVFTNIQQEEIHQYQTMGNSYFFLQKTFLLNLVIVTVGEFSIKILFLRVSFMSNNCNDYTGCPRVSNTRETNLCVNNQSTTVQQVHYLTAIAKTKPQRPSLCLLSLTQREDIFYNRYMIGMSFVVVKLTMILKLNLNIT